jgi:hypothetical protein
LVGKLLFVPIFRPAHLSHREWPRQSELYPPEGPKYAAANPSALLQLSNRVDGGFWGWGLLACQWNRRFATIGSTSRLPREKVSDGRRMPFLPLANLIVLEEKFHE